MGNPPFRVPAPHGEYTHSRYSESTWERGDRMEMMFAVPFFEPLRNAGQQASVVRTPAFFSPLMILLVIPSTEIPPVLGM
mmetsp:Transcript_36987/g.102805  ORF Transcript_36987/g.102805 Transcript_36987/m.102805 type:complete len:80 (-) Transcript_36987:76-315(-)